MILLTQCKEKINSKYNRYDFDFVFVDCFHNVNFIKIKDGRQYKKDILDEFNTGKYVSINKFNEYLSKYNLSCYTLEFQTIRRYICYCEIISSDKLSNLD